MKEAILYDHLDGKRAHCRVCARSCYINDGQRGYCWTRENRGGKIYSLIYNKVSSMNADPIEKKPVFHYHPSSYVYSAGTWGCNLRCIHCQNWEIACVDPTPHLSSLEDVTPEELVSIALLNDCRGIAWTYNEPTIWLEYTIDSAKLARERGLYTVYVTNGYATAEAIDAIGPFLDVYRVDIKAFNNEAYMKLARIPDMGPILECTLRAAKIWNAHIEVVTNLIPTFNDDEVQLTSMATWIAKNLGSDTPWHVTRFFPYGELSYLEPTPVDRLEWARQIGMDSGLRYVYIGNVPGHLSQNTFCPLCGATAIERSLSGAVRVLLAEDGHCPKCKEKLSIVL